MIDFCFTLLDSKTNMEYDFMVQTVMNFNLNIYRGFIDQQNLEMNQLKLQLR